MLAASPFSTSCGNALQAARLTPKFPPFNREVAAAMLVHHLSPIAVELPASSSSHFLIFIFQAGKHNRDAGCVSFLRHLWQCVSGSSPHSQSPSFRQEITAAMMAASLSSASCGNALQEACRTPPIPFVE